MSDEQSVQRLSNEITRSRVRDDLKDRAARRSAANADLARAALLSKVAVAIGEGINRILGATTLLPKA